MSIEIARRKGLQLAMAPALLLRRHHCSPEVPANCAWGDDGRTLYMTAVTGIYRIKTLIGK